MADAAKPATDEQMEAMRAAFAGTRTAMAPLTLVDGKAVTIASILARYDATAAEIKALREALAEARTWHEEERDALSKRPPRAGDRWQALQHRLQIDLINRALLEPSR